MNIRLFSPIIILNNLSAIIIRVICKNVAEMRKVADNCKGFCVKSETRLKSVGLLSAMSLISLGINDKKETSVAFRKAVNIISRINIILKTITSLTDNPDAV